MKKTSKPAPIAGPARRQAVTYARVSSKEQEKEGFSIPAQLKLLKEYAATNGFTVVQEYVDVETAKQTGRAAFGEMVAFLKAHPSVRVMLVEKTDRLYRNLKDWVTVDELDVEMHFPKEGVVLSRESQRILEARDVTAAMQQAMARHIRSRRAVAAVVPTSANGQYREQRS
jgi:site-specific DNA recombinase